MAFLHDLKMQTSVVHAALEKQLDIARHFESKSSYVKLLERFFSLYEPLEENLAQALDWQAQGWDFESRRKTPWLTEDLLALGLTVQDIAALPRCTALPDLRPSGAAVGCLYVLEGSTLGGQVITRLLNQHLEVSPEAGGRFFSGYAEATVPQWRSFGSWAEDWALRHPEQKAAAAEAASQTFDSFTRWFQ